jgi:uncharacterized protein YyaL (SSP411 family)
METSRDVREAKQPLATYNCTTGGVEPVKTIERLRHWAKEWLPFSVRSTLSTIENALQLRLYQPTHLKLWLHDKGGQGYGLVVIDRPRLLYQRVLLDWLKRAQDAAPGGGVAAYYALADGWSAAYPETTGYIIVTCLKAAKRLQDPELALRARRMADWELEVQLPEGAWQSGLVTAPRVPAVFNTGQVIQGLLAAYAAFGEPEYLNAALRGGLWLAANQEHDGAWRQYTYNNFPNTYSTRVAWPLLELAHVTKEDAFQRAALRYLQWASQCQDETGWLTACNLEVEGPPLTHTLGYAIEGFIEAGVLLNDDRWFAIGQRMADALLHRYEVRRRLAGTYDSGWRGDYSFACLTGCAQISMVWGRLFEHTGDARYLNGALKLNDFIMSLIDLKSRCPGIRGGVKGSHPVWGAYMSCRFPSWAVKFTVDALFQEEDALALHEASV